MSLVSGWPVNRKRDRVSRNYLGIARLQPQIVSSESGTDRSPRQRYRAHPSHLKPARHNCISHFRVANRYLSDG